MEAHYLLTDAEFELQFKDCTLQPSIFSHEAHIRLAWIHIKKYGVEMAIKNICHQIKKFDDTIGNGDKFHKTLTVGSVLIVDHFINKSYAQSFHDFIFEFPQLKTKFKDLLAAHYNLDNLKSDDARSSFLEPDIQPF